MTDSASAPDASASPGTYRPRMFQWRGRIGRLRFLAYMLGLGLLTTVLPMFVVALLASPGSTWIVVVRVLVTAAGIAVPVLVCWRRLNDMGYTGWQTLGLAIPLVNAIVLLWLAFARGEEGPNRYGPAPAPNTPGIVAAALLLVALVLIGGVAAFLNAPYPGYQQQSAPAGQVL